ncbi:MAG TPA: hypothetical protein VIK33_16970 [Anaerolineae bacterium]
MDLGFWIGFGLTIAVLSYLIRDNFLYRLAMHILIGVGAAYAVAVALSQVIVPRVLTPLPNLLRLQSLTAQELGQLVFAVFGVLGSVFLLAKLFRRVAWLGNAAVGYLLGVGAGVAIGGALLGTLLPQSASATASLNSAVPGSSNSVINLLVNLLALAATVTALIAFAYSRAARRSFLGLAGGAGRTFLYIAFGATFALVFVAGASVLSGWLRDVFLVFFPPGG